MLATLAPVGVTLVQIKQDIDGAERRAHDHAHSVAAFAAGALESHIRDARNAAGTISRLPAFFSGTAAERSEILIALAGVMPGYVGLTYYGEDGTLDAATSLRQYSMPESLLARATSQSSLLVRQPVFTHAAMLDHATGRRLLPLIIPLDNPGAGRRRGYLAGLLSVDRVLGSWADSLLPADGSLLLIDMDSSLIMLGTGDLTESVNVPAPEASLSPMREGRPTFRLTPPHDGQERLRSWAPLAGTSWVVAADIPTRVVFGSIYAQAGERLGVSIAVAVIAFATLVAVGRKLRSTLYALRAAAGRWSAGQWAYRTGIRGADELARLAVTFDDMADRLATAEHQRAAAEEAMRVSEARYRMLVEQAADGIFVLDADGRIEEVNARACDLFSQPAELLLARTLSSLVAEPGGGVRQGQPQAGSAGECLLRRLDGSLLPVEMSLCRLSDGRSLAIVRDVSERYALQRRLRHEASHDALTGLPNRRMLQSRLARELDDVEPNLQPGGLLLLDLDGFKEVNDTLGHRAGDILLQEVARRLSGAVRGQDLVARLGGDEFAVFLPSTSRDGVLQVALHLLSSLEPPALIEGRMLTIGGSLGVACYPAHSADPDGLLRCADVAMYVAKRGRTGFSVYGTESTVRLDGAA